MKTITLGPRDVSPAAALGLPAADRPQEAPAREREATTRLVGVDILRVVALAAVVWFHTGAPGAHYMAWRLPTMAIITATLSVAAADRRPWGRQVRKAGSRLLLPWLFWCAVYGAVAFGSYLRRGAYTLPPGGRGLLLVGPSMHLWYLPFAFFVVAATSALRRLTAGMSPVRAAAGSAALAVAVIASLAAWGEGRAAVPTPAPQWLGCLPALPLGLAFGAAWADRDSRPSTFFGIFAASAAACGLLATAYDDRTALRYAGAVSLVGLAPALRFTPPRWLRHILGMALGAYAAHGLAMHLVHKALVGTSVIPPASAAHAIASIVVSFALVEVLSRTPLRRFV